MYARSTIMWIALLIVFQAIALPAQSITLEKDPNAPTTKRKLTFNDLVSHLKHHNSGVKKGMPSHAPSSYAALMVFRCVAWPARIIRGPSRFN
jgi:hypothetical protein